MILAHTVADCRGFFFFFRRAVTQCQRPGQFIENCNTLRHFIKGRGGHTVFLIFSTLIQKQIKTRKTKIKQLKTTPLKKAKKKQLKSKKQMKNKDSKRDLTKNRTQKNVSLEFSVSSWFFVELAGFERFWGGFQKMIFLHLLYILFLFAFWICFYFWLLDMCFTFNLCFLLSQAFLWVIGVLTLNKTQIYKHISNLKWTSNEPDLDVNRTWNDSEMYSQ